MISVTSKALTLLLALTGTVVVHAEDGLRVKQPIATEELASELQNRPASKDLPEEMIEVFRIEDKDAEFSYDEETGALVVKKKFDLRTYDPPGIEGESLDIKLLDDKNFFKRYAMEELDGKTPEHLAFTANPEFLQSFAQTNLAEGNDIPTNVFPADTRYVFQSTSYPWSTVGRVRTAAGTCTGTMVGRNLMLTATHCVNFLNGGGIGWMSFTPSYYNGNAPFGIAWATGIWFWTQVDGSNGLSDQETAFDYAIVRLNTNMGDLTGYTGYRTYRSSWNNGNYWQNIGYPGGLTGTQRPTFSGSGAITSVGTRFASGQTGYVLGNYIDTEGGHSGGPVWGWWSGEAFPRIVGDVSAESANPGPGTSGDNEAGGGPALSALISWARANISS